MPTAAKPAAEPLPVATPPAQGSTCCPSHEADAVRVAALPTIARAAYGRLHDSSKALTAYELIDALQPTSAQRIYPQTIYRALTVLTEQGLIHRIASTNAYRACSTPGTPHEGIHLLCICCGRVEEAIDPRINALLVDHARAHAFRIDTQVIEVSGLCSGCRDAGATAPSPPPPA